MGTQQEEQWGRAWAWMQKYGDRWLANQPPTPRLPFQHLPNWASHGSNLIDELDKLVWARPPDMGKTLDFKRAYQSPVDWIGQYYGHLPDASKPYFGLPDSFSNQVGQPGKVDDTLIRAAKKLVDQAWNPPAQAAYVDQDGTEHRVEPLEDRPEGELCMTCGASWRCEC